MANNIDQTTISELSLTIKQNLKKEKYKGTKPQIKEQEIEFEKGKTKNRKLGWKNRKLIEEHKDLKTTEKRRTEILKEIKDNEADKADTKWNKNRLSMLEGKDFMFEIDNKFGVELWNKKRNTYNINSKQYKDKTPEQIEKLILGRLLKGLDQNLKIEKHPSKIKVMKKFKKIVEDYKKAVETGVFVKGMPIITVDIEEGEIELFIAGS